MVRIRAQRIMTTGMNGKIVRAVLQEQEETGTIGQDDYSLTWIDVKELEISEDGKAVSFPVQHKEETA